MHIHHGMKEKNPVGNIRFFPKHRLRYNDHLIAREIDEEVYRTQLPLAYEDKKIRVFCRCKEKVPLARKAFENWCKKVCAHSPFPSSELIPEVNGDYVTQNSQ
jgi:hypothetical protein